MTEIDHIWPQMTPNDQKRQKLPKMTANVSIDSNWKQMTANDKWPQITANDKNWLEMIRMIRNDQSLHFEGMHADCNALDACTLCINVSYAKHEGRYAWRFKYSCRQACMHLGKNTYKILVLSEFHPQ